MSWSIAAAGIYLNKYEFTLRYADRSADTKYVDGVAAGCNAAAVLGEELGIFGIIFLIFLFYLLFRKCFKIGDKALRVDLNFQGLLAYAIGIYLMIQVLLNLSVNLGLLPTKGLSLPFFSYGGSNYLVSLLAVTIVFRIYRDVYKKALHSSIR